MVRSEDSQYTAPYTGMIPIRSGEIAEDFAMYLADSEQTNSAVGLGVAIGTDLSVLAAGGFLVNVSYPGTALTLRTSCSPASLSLERSWRQSQS